jgi:hypothetical protein
MIVLEHLGTGIQLDEETDQFQRGSQRGSKVNSHVKKSPTIHPS